MWGWHWVYNGWFTGLLSDGFTWMILRPSKYVRLQMLQPGVTHNCNWSSLIYFRTLVTKSRDPLNGVPGLTGLTAAGSRRRLLHESTFLAKRILAIQMAMVPDPRQNSFELGSWMDELSSPKASKSLSSVRTIIVQT